MARPWRRVRTRGKPQSVEQGNRTKRGPDVSCLVDEMTDYGEGSLDARPITVLIADDHPLVIGGIRRALEGHDDIEVVGEAHSGPEVLAMVERRRPRLVLLDLNMPGVDGLGCIEQIAAAWPGVK